MWVWKMKKRLLYHMTDYQNLPSIINSGGLTAYSQIVDQKIDYSDIAHQSVQQRRSTTRIKIPPYGILHDYVPFYFATRSPMLYAIKNGNVEGYSGTESDIIYIVTRTDIVSRAEKKFVFTDGHAIIYLTEFYNDLNDLGKIDWNIMSGEYWNDTDEYPDRKRKRQAEFLINQFVEIDLFLGFGVKNNRMKRKVMDILEANNIDKQVIVKPDFYF